MYIISQRHISQLPRGILNVMSEALSGDGEIQLQIGKYLATMWLLTMGDSIDPEASQQIHRKLYVDDGVRGTTREQVERFRVKREEGRYNGTNARSLGLVNLDLKVMIAIGDDDEESFCPQIP